MTGEHNMLGDTLTRVGEAVRHRDVVYKRYVDTVVYKGYVDTQTVDKNGGEMLSNLNMNGRLVHVLPEDYPTDYRGDAAISWRHLKMI